MKGYLDENKFTKKNEINIHLGKIYLLLLIISGIFIYFYSNYQYNYLKFLYSYALIWQISLVLIGISMIRVRNVFDLSIGLSITVLSLAVTTIGIFNYQFNIKNNIQNNIVKTNSVNKINFNMDLVTGKTVINTNDLDQVNINLNSNYERYNYEGYIDSDNTKIIELSQTSFPSGLGSYNKFNDIFFPKLIPITLNIKSNLSILKLDLTNMNLDSSNIDISNSQLDIIINSLDIKKESILNLKSISSNINISISKDIEVILTNSSKLSFNSFQGIEKDSSDSKKYKSAWVPMQYQDKNESESNIYKTEQKEVTGELNNEIKTEPKNYTKTLIINLDSTLSKVKIIQQ